MTFEPKFKDMVETALRAESNESRALATQAIGRTVRDRTLTEIERDLSDRIFRILANDVCEEVRRALAITLRLSDALPHDVANRLIHDVDTIAVPILSSSPVITDDDLVDVLQSKAGVKSQAIASRRGISSTVSRAVLSYGDRNAVLALAANDSALISETDATRLVDMAQSDDLIRDAALRRQDMPQALAAKLIDTHVDQVATGLEPDVSGSDRIARDTGTRAKARWSANDWSADAVQAYVEALHTRGDLDQATVARSAGQGDWRFVQLALAKLAGISPSKAAMMVLDDRPFALQLLIKRSGLEDAACELVLASAQAFRDMERSGAVISRARFQRQMVERIASHPAATHHGSVWMDWLDDGLGPQAL